MLTANRDDRTIAGLVLPFGQRGFTNKGAVTASKGTVTIPEAAQVTLNLEHERRSPVGRAVALEEREDGIYGTFKVAATTAGDDLLTEVAEGLRTGFSVELVDNVIRAGKILAGRLAAVAAVVDPAFDSARVLTAADCGDLPEEGQDNEASDADVARDKEEDEEETMADEPMVATVPQGVGTKAKSESEPLSVRQATKLLAGAWNRGGDALMAALTDIKHDDGDGDGDGLGEIAAAPAWLGEVWSDVAYDRKFIPLLASGTLSSWQEVGFRFTTTPTVAKYSGNKAAVPSTGMAAEAVKYGVERWANAADIDRRFVDFGDQQVIEAFIRANAESYAEVTDLWALEELVAAAEAVTAGTVPTGINAAAAAIVDGALALIADRLKPTAAIIGSDLYRDLLLTPQDKGLEYLSVALGMEKGELANFPIVPTAEESLTSQVMVLDGRTVRFKELGSTPIRVEAENVANGGRDIGVFGYTSFQVLKDGGVRVLDLSTTGE